MKDNSTKRSGGGIGFGSLLTIAFIILKLCHVINWSWFWVLSPMIFSIALVLIILGVWVIIIGMEK